ncbi:PREDICTED: uncharacterized protein LOC109227482 isoform X2 [Nicotiana attenuata]|uniref:uncharacterized protein LOC109227482 isoform X2 n=1 Tax=Nicotiana attenuata TaxID=49451 RepID=UPI000904CF6D|nr:PREDICTED: uncharacterized protein LOC109227482 isoform X2 [Nicotiana attenuata]
MDVKKIVVIVEDVEIAKTALQWTLHNLLRYGDILILLHVFPITKSRSKKKLKILRLKGFQLALSFYDLCKKFLNTKTEIVVTQGDQDGGKIADVVREIGVSTVVAGLHDQSFLYSVPEVNPPKIPYQVCPDPHSIIWRSGKSRRWET